MLRSDWPTSECAVDVISDELAGWPVPWFMALGYTIPGRRAESTYFAYFLKGDISAKI